MAQIKRVITPNVEEIKSEINQDKSIIIAGSTGVGKTIMLNELLQNEVINGSFIANGTIQYNEYLTLKYTEVYNLYHTCLIVKKILLSVRQKYENEFLCFLRIFDAQIDLIIKRITMMYLTDIYKHKEKIDEDLLKSPEILIDILLGMLSKILDIKDITLIIDDFDKVAGSSQRYQEFIYNRIRQQLNVIMAISDKNVVNNEGKLNEFAEENKVIKLDYSKEIEVVKEILDKESIEALSRSGDFQFKYRIGFVLSDEAILLMIQKTNGNLFDMMYAVRELYRHINELTQDEYETFIIDFIDKEINKNPIFTGIIIPERKLYIKRESY